MKNINKLNIEKGDFKSHIEYFIIKGDAVETLESLGQPETALQAKENLKNLISKDKKYKDIIPLDDELLYKILFQAFSEKRSIKNQLDIFLRQISSKVAGVRVEISFIVQQIANNTYNPVNNEDSTLLDVA